jgi:hypothetical protein
MRGLRSRYFRKVSRWHREAYWYLVHCLACTWNLKKAGYDEGAWQMVNRGKTRACEPCYVLDLKISRDRDFIRQKSG